jgi:peptide deformylase
VDDVLLKQSRPVEKIDRRILTLLDDMRETVLKADGVGLAAPQVGVLKRVVVVVDTNNDDEIVELINPEVVDRKGLQNGYEGCLSVPGKFGKVKRAKVVTVRAMDRDGNVREVIGRGLTARAFEHEIDHLDGKIFVDKVTKWSKSSEN